MRIIIDIDVTAVDYSAKIETRNTQKLPILVYVSNLYES